MEKSNIVFGGDCSHTQNDCLDITGFTENHFPLRNLELPITASRLSKGECRLLVEKITAKILTSISRHISYARRVILINSILFGMYNFYAEVFILPQEVILQVSKSAGTSYGKEVSLTKKLLALLGTQSAPQRSMGG